MTDSISFIPNSYSTPNAFADRLMHLLEPTEWKVLCCVIRHILGWHDKIASRIGSVSLTLLTDGFTSKDGIRYFGTGLSRPTVIRDLKNLVQYRVLVKVGKAGKDGQKYQIPESDKDIDFEGLNKRILEKFQSGQKRTGIAAKKSAEKRRTGKSDVPAVVNPIYQQEYVAHTSTGKSDVPNITISNTIQKQDQNNILPKTEVSAANVKVAPPAQLVEQKTEPAPKQESEPITVTAFKEALEPTPKVPAKGSPLPEGQYVPPAGHEQVFVSRQVDQESRTHIEHLIASGLTTPSPVCKRCGLALNDGLVSQIPSWGVSYKRCLGKEPKPRKARDAPVTYTAEVKNALALLCKKDWTIPANASAMGRTLKQLDGKINVAMLERFEANWYKCDFRGLKGQAPKPHQVIDEWTELTESDECKDGTGTLHKPGQPDSRMENADAGAESATPSRAPNLALAQSRQRAESRSLSDLLRPTVDKSRSST